MQAIGPLTGTASGRNKGGKGENIFLFLVSLTPRLWFTCLKKNMLPGNNNAFTIFTGDLTSHDNDNQLSRGYVEYVESAIFSLFKAYLAGPVYAALVCQVLLLLFTPILRISIDFLYRVITIHGPKLSMHLTVSNRRLFQTNLTGTTLIWQSKLIFMVSLSMLMLTLVLVSGKPKAGFHLQLQLSPNLRESVILHTSLF